MKLLALLLAVVALAAGLTAWRSRAATAARAHPATAPAAPASTLRLGDQTLTRCPAEPAAFCGSLRVPVDRADLEGPRISIHYRFYPARGSARPTARTVLPLEGGPGYSTIASVESGYAPMYGRLLRRWNLLAIDARGTGESAALSCPALQRVAGSTATAAFGRAVRVCGRALNHRWRDASGGWVHASDRFGSVAAADDIAAIVHALGLGRVDVYGDSYGSYLAQVLVREHPELARSVVLDSAYGLADLDPWYESTIRVMPAAFDAACRRWAPCATAAAGPAWSDIAALAKALRRHPLQGRAPGLDGGVVRVRMTSVGLVDLVNDAAEDPEIYRELDAAARAWLDDHAARPLLRLYEQRLQSDEDYGDQPARDYSAELYLAVACTDYPQLFDMSAPPAVRRAQLARLERGAPGRFRPFTVGEWLAQNQNTETYTACLNWPATQTRERAAAAPRLPADTPVLILGGGLDTWTPPSADHRVLAQLGGRGRVVEIANATHVVGEQDSACATRLIRGFVAQPGQVARLDAACAGGQPPIHAVGRFADALGQVEPARPARAGELTPPLLRLAAAAVATTGDAVARDLAISVEDDPGLYGGRAVASPDGAAVTLIRDELIPGVRVSGTIRLHDRAAADGTSVRARLTARAGGLRLRLTATYLTVGRSPARLTVRVDDHRAVVATVAAP